MLSTGIKAPDFTLPDQNGKLHSLKDYAGRRLIMYANDKVRASEDADNMLKII